MRLRRGLGGCRAQLLVRLRAGRRFYADPEGPPAKTGRPRRHGPKFDCKDPNSWPEPTHEHLCENDHYGKVRVRAWAKLHPKVRLHEGRGSRGPLPIVRGTLVLVEVGRLPRGERRREPKRSSGCGGMALENRTSTFSGAPTLGASTWSIPSASSSRAWGGHNPSGAPPRAGRPLELADPSGLRAVAAGTGVRG